MSKSNAAQVEVLAQVELWGNPGVLKLATDRLADGTVTVAQLSELVTALRAKHSIRTEMQNADEYDYGVRILGCKGSACKGKAVDPDAITFKRGNQGYCVSCGTIILGRNRKEKAGACNALATAFGELKRGKKFGEVRATIK